MYRQNTQRRNDDIICLNNVDMRGQRYVFMTSRCLQTFVKKMSKKASTLILNAIEISSKKNLIKAQKNNTK
jgi:hypothetical protein